MTLKEANKIVARTTKGLAVEGGIAVQVQALAIVVLVNLGIGPAMEEKFYDELKGTSLSSDGPEKASGTFSEDDEAAKEA